MDTEDLILLLGAVGVLLFSIILSGIGAKLWCRYSLQAEDKPAVRKPLPVKKVIPEAARRSVTVTPSGEKTVYPDREGVRR